MLGNTVERRARQILSSDEQTDRQTDACRRTLAAAGRDSERGVGADGDRQMSLLLLPAALMTCGLQDACTRIGCAPSRSEGESKRWAGRGESAHTDDLRLLLCQSVLLASAQDRRRGGDGKFIYTVRGNVPPPTIFSRLSLLATCRVLFTHYVSELHSIMKLADNV